MSTLDETRTSTVAENRHFTVLGLLHDHRAISCFHRAFGAHFLSRPLLSGFDEVAETCDPRVIVVEPWDVTGQPTAPFVHRIVHRRPDLRVVVYSNTSERAVHELVALIKAGAEQLVVRCADDDPVSLRRWVALDPLETAVHCLVQTAQGIVPARLLPLVQHCLEDVGASSPLEDVARKLGGCRRTLSKRAHSVGLRGVRAVRMRCRLLVAIELLRRHSFSAEQAALRVGFSSVAHLRRAMTHHTGKALREVMTRPSTTYWCARLFTVWDGEGPGYLRS